MPGSRSNPELLPLADRVADVLAQRILVGEIAPGQRLRQEMIARDFGISQAMAREAFRKLENRRLLQSEPRRGVRVTPLDAQSEREIAAMRAALEPLALRSIRGRITPRQMQVVRSALEAGDKAENIYTSEEANRAFHIALTAPCGMPRLMSAIVELNLAYSRYVFASERATRWRARTNLDHWRVYDAYAASDFETAARLLASHISWVDRVTHAKARLMTGETEASGVAPGLLPVSWTGS